MAYTKEDYLSDLKNKDMLHIKSPERFSSFYEELGKMDVQKSQQYRPDRMSFVVPKGRILELGCHNGFNLIHYARLGFDVVGVDISSSLLEYAKERLGKEKEEVRDRVTLVQSWIEKLPFEPSVKFDTVILTEVLEHAIEPLPIMQSAGRCLADTGTLFVSAPSTRTGNFSHVRGVPPKALEHLAVESGLTTSLIYARDVAPKSLWTKGGVTFGVFTTT